MLLFLLLFASSFFPIPEDASHSLNEPYPFMFPPLHLSSLFSLLTTHLTQAPNLLLFLSLMLADFLSQLACIQNLFYKKMLFVVFRSQSASGRKNWMQRDELALGRRFRATALVLMSRSRRN